ncbi:hypothetical protein KJ359_004311 [Pestalotiopsis sp. 9143b]|nr:hypothetical protein KJ359_004311 [Pestalotiopsis sp. 9143b]
MILMTRNELESNQKDDDFKLVLVSTLGELFGEKCLHTGDENTIQEAVRLAQEVVDSTPEGHQDTAGRVSNLGLQLGRQWQCCRHKKDLDLSITMARTALRQPNLSSSVQANLYFNLGARLGDECLVARDLSVMKEAVDCLRKAIQISPPEEINRTEFLVSLGRLLHDKYTHEGKVQDLKEAIRLTREARALGQQNEVDKAKTSAYLGLYLFSQFIRSGEIGDLDKAIDETECAANALLNDHVEKLAWLNNLAIQMGDRYFRSGAAADLERAIEIMREVVARTKPGDPNRPSRLSNLALRLGDRYARVGALADLNEAIELMRTTLTIEPQLSQSDQPLLLNNLSIRLAERWDRTGNENDLDEAVRRSQEAVEKSRPDHQDITRWYINLGVHLAARYQLKGHQEDFKKANDAYQKAASIIPDKHPYRAPLFNNMGLLFAEKYTHSKKSEDLNKAIGHSRDSVSATATDATSWAMRSRNLARQLYQRYLHEDKTEDRSESRELLIRALRSSTASIKVRVAAGRDFIFTEDKLDDPQSYDILKQLVHLLPLLALPPLHNSDKHHLLSEAVGIASDAAAMALSFEKGEEGAFAAISCLETGRAIIAGGTFLAHDLSRLEKVDKSLAEKFVGLRDQLAGPEPTDTVYTSHIQDPSVAIERQSATLELDAILQQIRLLDGFERFLLPESQADIVSYANQGPIVMINLSKYRCDALIIQQSGVQSLSLPHVSLAQVESYGREPGSVRTMNWLWRRIVHPVLRALGFADLPDSQSLKPHVWWIPTGKLTRLPLHAAGNHLQADGRTALDMVVSSYASSIKAIVRGRRQSTPISLDASSLRVVAVAMEQTEKQRRLRHAVQEVNQVLSTLGIKATPKSRPRTYKHDVLSAIKACDIFHFAGHGQIHATAPLESSLLLSDWEKNPLTVQNFMEGDLANGNPFLAYLSACGTSRIKDEGALDENIHLANACQLAGFRHVVGTLWSVDDEQCVQMARKLYEFMVKEGFRDDTVSRGLHYATKFLRDQWVQSHSRQESLQVAREAEVIEDHISQPDWVPYIHFGL